MAGFLPSRTETPSPKRKSSPRDMPENLPASRAKEGDPGQGLAEHTLRGEVEKVLFQSDDEAYSVFMVRDAQGCVHTVVGTVPGVCPGQGIEVSGSWETHKDHGRQLRAAAHSFTLPATVEGIQKYLASGALPGIGAKYAERIVEKFGLKTLEMLDNYPARLKEVEGLGKKRIDAIRKAWKENAERRKLQIHLQSLGIGPAAFVRIYKLYGDKAAAFIKENPYRLADDIDGIGFLMADRIAGNLGLQGNDMKRLLSGVSYVFSQLRLAGHVCFPETEFIKSAASLLGVEEDHASAALKEAIERKIASVDVSKEGVSMVYETAFLKIEKELPRLLATLVSTRSRPGELMRRVPAKQGTSFSDEQLRAVDAVTSSPVSVITGGPGVGKTTVVGEIVRRAKSLKLRILLAAPTGRAAKRMSEATGIPAFTIHRMLKWEPEKRTFVHGRDLHLNCDVMVVDESSMLDITLAVCLLRAVKPGATLVIVGDADQLPSVGPGNVLNDIIKSGAVPVSRLTKIFRQGPGSGIIRNAHAVNSGHMPNPSGSDAKGPLADFYWVEKDDADEAAALIERLGRERIPKRFGLNPMTDVQVLCPMNRGSCGTIAMNQRLQAALNPDARLAFKAGERLFKSGDRVMQTSNNYDKGVFNGDMGRITKINHSGKKFHVAFDSEEVEYEFYEADQLNLAYAVTVHKSQGSEFPAVIMTMLTQHYMMLHRNLLYTGMTRAKRLMVLIGSKKAISMAVTNFVREPRHSLLLERLETAFRQLRRI